MICGSFNNITVFKLYRIHILHFSIKMSYNRCFISSASFMFQLFVKPKELVTLLKFA